MPEPVQLGLDGRAVPVVTRSGRSSSEGAAAARDGIQQRLFEPLDVMAGQQALEVDSVAVCQTDGERSCGP